MRYDRKIKYVDYYENGERVKGGGFVKLEVHDGVLKMDMNIRGLHSTDSFVRDVVLRGSETEAVIGRITLQEGAGSFHYSCELTGGIGSTGISYEELQEIKIPVGGSRELCCAWERSSSKAAVPAEVSKIENPIMESTETENSEAGIIEAEVREPEVRKPEIQEPEVQEPEVREAEAQELETRVSEAREPETRVSEAEEPEILGLEVQESETREAEVRESELCELETRVSEVREPEILGSEVQEPETREPDPQERGSLMETPPKREIQESEVQKTETPLKETSQAELQDITRPDSKPTEISKKNIRETKCMALESERRESVRKGQSSQGEKPVVKLLEDKWQQLSAVYPHIRPFQDEREYLSLSPSDFVMFPESYYRAANNSFLLHGFYNYKHLILARIELRGEARYFLGVPGNYYEREKQVAIMFGFESFECAREPAKTGDFGYYMMRMEL